jgi:hypothetical protein
MAFEQLEEQLVPTPYCAIEACPSVPNAEMLPVQAGNQGPAEGISGSSAVRRLASSYFHSLASNALVTVLLRSLEWALCLSTDYYQKNARNFEGAYRFRSRDGWVDANLVFRDGEITVNAIEVEDWDVIVTVENGASLWELICKGEDDLMRLVLSGSVQVQGNVTFLYKLHFMLRDLARRIGANSMGGHCRVR